jgi:hypothetical protein
MLLLLAAADEFDVGCRRSWQLSHRVTYRASQPLALAGNSDANRLPWYGAFLQ